MHMEVGDLLVRIAAMIGQDSVAVVDGTHLPGNLADGAPEAGDFPVAERTAQEILALPVYPELTQEMQDHVIKTTLDFGT